MLANDEPSAYSAPVGLVAAVQALHGGSATSIEHRVIAAAPDGILLISADGEIRLANPAVRALTGYEPHELVGQRLERLLPESVRPHHDRWMAQFFQSQRSRAMGSGAQLSLLHRAGHEVQVDIALGMCRAGEQPLAVVFLRDCTEARRMTEALRHQASHDALTGLHNRSQFQAMLELAVAQTSRNGHQCAVLLLDLDDFKRINDAYGHAAGDALLIEVAARLRQALRGADVVARLGGDEFAMLLPDVAEDVVALRVADKVLAALAQPCRIDGHLVEPAGSIGVALCPLHASDAKTLMRYADLAMYAAKSAGRQGAALYQSAMGEVVHARAQIQDRLRHALRHGGLALHYQPLVGVEHRRIESVEALLRWNDPELGQVPPDRFIPVAEASGLILPLGDWVLETACAQAAAWRAAGWPLRVAVNLSPHQFRLKDLPRRVADLLQRHQLPASALELEVTESQAMENPIEAREKLHELARMGVTLALDDFGTGHSSLAQLKGLPVHRLKIDREFVRGVPQDGFDVSLVRGMVALARNLSLGVVAEGVETAVQWGFLRHCGVQEIQGWLVSRAVPASEIDALLVQAQDWNWIQGIEPA